jgi:hypothetical protein
VYKLTVKGVWKKMNVLSSFCLYLFVALLLIALCVANILPQNYLGGFVIAGFIAGVCFPFFNATRQGEKMIAREKAAEIYKEEEISEREEKEIVVRA